MPQQVVMGLHEQPVFQRQKAQQKGREPLSSPRTRDGLESLSTVQKDIKGKVVSFQLENTIDMPI